MKTRILNELVKEAREWKFALKGKNSGKWKGEKTERPRCKNARNERGEKRGKKKKRRMYKLLAWGQTGRDGIREDNWATIRGSKRVAPSQGICLWWCLSVAKGNSCLFVHPTRGHPSFQCNLATLSYFTFFWSSLIFESPPTGLSPLFHRLYVWSSRVLSLARRAVSGFARTDIFFGSFGADRKNGDSGRQEAKGGRKKWKKKWPEDREKSDASPRQRTRPTIGRIICSFGKNDSNGDTRERSG